MLLSDDTLCPLELERQDCPKLSSTMQPSAQKEQGVGASPVPLASPLLSSRPSSPPSRALLQAAGLEIQGKGLGYCPAPPRSFEVVFKGFWAIPSSFFPLLPLPKCKSHGSSRDLVGRECNERFAKVAAPILDVPRGHPAHP